MNSTKRLRVAFISFNFGEYSVRLASALAQNAEVLLFLPEALAEPHMTKLDKTIRLESFHKPRIRQVSAQLRCMRSLFRKIRALAPDVIHYQGAHLWFDLVFPFLLRYPRVFTIHDFRPHPGDQPFQQTPFLIESFARGCADELIVHSCHTRELVLGKLRGFRDRISVIPHIQIGEAVPPACVTHEEPLILFFGRIWPYKGLEYLIRAEPLITARVPEAKFLIAGQGEDFSRYRRMMVHQDRFIVHNKFVPDDEAADYFRRASVVVLPYIEASQSGVIPMAYSAGKPVVATTVGGLPEMVENGRTGYVVAPGDSVQLAEAVTKLLSDEPLRRRMGANAKRKIEEECSPSVVAGKTMEVYRRAVEGTAQVRKAVLVRDTSSV